MALFFLALPHSVRADAAKTSYRYTGNVTFDLGKVPFSRYGSYMAFSTLSGKRAPNAQPGLYLRNLHGSKTDYEHPVFRIELLVNDSPVPFSIKAAPTVLHLKADAGTVDIYFPEANQVRFAAQGVSVRFISAEPELTVSNNAGRWEIRADHGNLEKYMAWAIDGRLDIPKGQQNLPTGGVPVTFTPTSGSRRLEGEIDTYDKAWTPHSDGTSFAEGLEAEETKYQEWLKHMPEVSPEFGPGAELAAYVNWSSVVAPMGFLDRPTMLMSKNWMARVWAWDHTFNAMALSLGNPDLAWDQFMVLFDNQEANGALPDTVREMVKETAYSKPPIHGLALTWMVRHGHFDDAKHLTEVYEPLSRWTEWYFRYRDVNGDGLPEYNHGSDSGWDNSTVFLSDAPMETPDLSSFLILQMDTLSSIAHKLGKEKEAETWQSRSDALLKKMLTILWKGDHFIALRADNGKEVESESLLLYMPLMLGNKLPVEVQRNLIKGLNQQGRFRTSHGFATEALDSKYYTPDGYWLGPIWAPASMLLSEGMDSIGEKKLARDLRSDFCKMVQESGMSENFDAKTGAALRDPAYTWTSSVYLIFAHQMWTAE